MATSKSKKQVFLDKLLASLKEAQGIAFIRFEKVTVGEAQIVRRELRASGMTYQVIKRTLIAKALKETGIAEISSDDMEGMVAVITSPTDIVEPAQFIKKFKKDFFVKKEKFAKFDFAGAIFEGNFLDAKAAEQFANTPTREESLARISGALRFGVRGIHSGLTYGLRGITMAMKEADKLQKS